MTRSIPLLGAIVMKNGQNYGHIARFLVELIILAITSHQRPWAMTGGSSLGRFRTIVVSNLGVDVKFIQVGEMG